MCFVCRLVWPKFGLCRVRSTAQYMHTYVHYSMAYMHVRTLLLSTYIYLYVAIIWTRIRTHMYPSIPISFPLIIGNYYGTYMSTYTSIRGLAYV